MSLSPAELADRLHYPPVWRERGLFADDLYRVQLAAFAAEARERGAEPDDYRPAHGTEHYRYGAFHFWLRRGPGPEILEALMEAAVDDPDPGMAGAAMKDLLAVHHPGPALVERAIRAVRRSPGYFLSEAELRAFLPRADPDDDLAG